MSIEIERKFVVENIPENLDIINEEEILQGYILICDDKSEMRVRSKGTGFSLTVKKPGLDHRIEVEIEIDESAFNQFWPLTIGKRILKTRTTINYHNFILELDQYEGILAYLKIIEVEFKTIEERKQFQPPSWFGIEVTNYAEFNNQSLAH